MKHLFTKVAAAALLSLAITAVPVNASEEIDWGDYGPDDYLGTYIMEWTYGSPWDMVNKLEQYGEAFNNRKGPFPSSKRPVTATVKDETIFRDGQYFDPMGIHVNPFVKGPDGIVDSETETYPTRVDTVPLLQNIPIKNGVFSVTIPKCPEDLEGKKAWLDQYRPLMDIYLPGGPDLRIRSETVIMILYAPHVHDTSGYGWSYDSNCHWTYCSRCPQFVHQSWHQDLDLDGVCDVCAQPVTYRNLTVKDSEGGKVTLSADKAMLGSRIAVTVEAEPGYRLDHLTAKNNNEDKYSIRPCFEDVKGSQYHFIVDVYDVEVSAEFVKE